MSSGSFADRLENAIRDVRYGLRLLRRSPIFAAVAILSLALGIGANAAIFQLIDTIRTLPEPGYPVATYEIIGVVGDTK